MKILKQYCCYTSVKLFTGSCPFFTADNDLSVYLYIEDQTPVRDTTGNLEHQQNARQEGAERCQAQPT